MPAGQRPKSPPSDVEVPTDQGPPGEELSSRVFDEPELPHRAGPKKEKSEPRAVAPDPNAGDTVGDYELLEKLGKGGAGSVFRARKRADGSIVALKVLSASKAKRARIVQRFFDEVRAAQAVKHPGLIRVLDFIEEDDPRRLAYAMEFVGGETLRERLRKDTALDLREAIHVGAEVAGALAALHDAGIIHRDLKPENIMLIYGPGSRESIAAGAGSRESIAAGAGSRESIAAGAGSREPIAAGVSGAVTAAALPKVKLLDFGVVKFLPFDRSGASNPVPTLDEKKGTFVGTPRYMAPEQAAGGVVDARADLFSIGVLLFEMITGRCPHEGDSLRDVVMAKLKGAPRVTVNPGKEILPQELADVVDACLKLKPALRPKDAREVQRALMDAEAVLFVVGPVKQDEHGSFSRPASQLSLPPVSGSYSLMSSLTPHASSSVSGSHAAMSPPAGHGSTSGAHSMPPSATHASGSHPSMPALPPKSKTPAPGAQSLAPRGSIAPGEAVPQAGVELRAAQTNTARKIALVMIIVAVLIVIVALAIHLLNDEPTLIVPLDSPQPAPSTQTATRTSTAVHP